MKKLYSVIASFSKHYKNVSQNNDMARDILNEINELKRRNPYNSRLDFEFHLQSLEGLIENLQNIKQDHKTELLKYIPVSLVACLQAFFKATIKDLIDFGSPFRQNVKEFNRTRNIKFDFEIVDAIHSESLTIGDFVSHILSFNNFEDINSNISTIINADFINNLKKYEHKSEYVIEKFNKEFQNNTDEIISDLKNLFDLRNIICHEFTLNTKIEETQIKKYLHSTAVFLRQSNSFIFNIQYPNAPETQMEMNQHAEEEFNKIDNQFENVLNRIINRDDKYEHQVDNEKFTNYINKWKEYRIARAECDSFNSAGGNMESLIYSLSMTRTTEEMIDSVKNHFPYIFDENYESF